MFITILSAWLLADFISGVVHWYEDRAMIGKSRFKFINGVRADNERHHKQPGFLVRLSYWENINTTAPIMWALAYLLIIAGAPVVMWLTALFLSFGNLVHRWAHEHHTMTPWVVKQIQKTGLFISGPHHAEHHYKDGVLVSREDSTMRFCVMTNWLNPILDGVGFFRKLEWLTGKGKWG